MNDLREMRQIHSPYAPSMFLLGARVGGPLVQELDAPLYVMGKGAVMSVALNRLCGEAIERISIKSKKFRDAWPVSDPVTGDAQVLNPKTFFKSPIAPRSHGCACHNQLDVAGLSAIEELWERRATQLWWEGEVGLRQFATTDPALTDINRDVTKLREKALDARHTVFFLIDGDFPVDVVVAVSHDTNFDQCAIAFAAGTGPRTALLRRVFEELLSVELEVADLLRARLDGDDIAPGTNRDLVKKRQKILKTKLQECLDTASRHGVHLRGSHSKKSMHEVLTGSAEQKAPIWMVDMTHEKIGVPTWRALFKDPELNPFVGATDTDILPI